MNTNKTCATCKFYRKVDYGYGRKPHMECDGPAGEHVFAEADDDQGLNSSFRPPETFGCNGWVAADPSKAS